MAAVSSTRASIRFVGEDLLPEDVTALLGTAPDFSCKKGDPWLLRGKLLVRRQGVWSVRATEAAPGDLDRQIEMLLARMSNDLTVWRDLCGRFRADVFCGVFIATGNEGLSLDPVTLSKLAERGLTLGLDIYAAPELQD